jgi:hypothetical protein
MSEKQRAAGLPMLGAVLAGIAGSVCCVGPLALVSVGVGGAWVATLTALTNLFNRINRTALDFSPPPNLSGPAPASCSCA